MQYAKAKSTSKVVMGPGKALQKKVKGTLRAVAALVGATLGPGGRPVLIERQENLPEFVTKDGITVFKSIGFDDPIRHSIMSAARDAAARTAAEAGDGTTTATVVADVVVGLMHDYLTKHPKESPQRVVRSLEKAFEEKIIPTLQDLALRKESYEDNRRLLHGVATVSANGDTGIADAVMEAVDLVGEKGHVTISELSGPPKYEVERIEGFSVGKGYEESCARFYPAFLNDSAKQRCYLEKPIFVLYDGSITETGSILAILEMIGAAYMDDSLHNANHVVLVAHGFSDMVLGDLALNFANPQSIYVYPLVTPQNMVQNSRSHFLQDLSAFTGAKVFDVINRPLESATLADFGKDMTYFESFRFRSTIVGQPDTFSVSAQAEILEGQLKMAESEYDKNILQERIGILTGGIAKIKVYGATQGELREKRDRVEDAVCSVRCAADKGVLPGGGKALLLAANLFTKGTKNMFGRTSYKALPGVEREVAEVLAPALRWPAMKILMNTGKSEKEIREITTRLEDSSRPVGEVYNSLAMVFCNAEDTGLLDSVVAVSEAVRNALSIASLLGTLGGCVVFPRDKEVEQQEARDTYEFIRNAGGE